MTSYWSRTSTSPVCSSNHPFQVDNKQQVGFYKLIGNQWMRGDLTHHSWIFNTVTTEISFHRSREGCLTCCREIRE
jgi:hypothetical protein